MRRVILAACSAVLMVGLAASAAAYRRPGRTELVSIASDGSQTHERGSEWPAITPDGRYVAFYSSADNLVPGDTNGDPDIFLRDRARGTTEAVSVDDAGRIGNSYSFAPRITPDGRYVAWESGADFTGDDPGYRDVFVRDRKLGRTFRISSPHAGGAASADSYHPAISDDGRFVAFDGGANDLVPGDLNPLSDVFLHDRTTGTRVLVSVTPEGLPLDAGAAYPYISGDGRLVTFNSPANLVVHGDTNRTYDTFVRDMEAGVTERVSVASDGSEGNGSSFQGMISADGRYVAFTSEATNLVPGDTNGSTWDVFVRDRHTGTTRRVTVASDGRGADDFSFLTGFSRDGRYVLFWSDAANLDPNDKNGNRDVFVHDTVIGTTELVSVASDPTGGDAMSWHMNSVTPGGRYVTFMSEASNILAADANDVPDIFLRDRGPELGVGPVEVDRVGDRIRVVGDATASGGVAAAANDPPSDAVPAAPVGGELAGADVRYRPEPGNIAIRWRTPGLHRLTAQKCSPLCLAAGTPAIEYRARFAVGGTAFEIRGTRADDPLGGASFALYRCDPGCAQVADSGVTGSIGSAEAEAVAQVPLASFGAQPGARLTGITASTWAARGADLQQELDQVALPDADLPVLSVELGSAARHAPSEEVAFHPAVYPVGGSFASEVPPGEAVWARTCLGEQCRVGRIATLP